MNTSKEWDLLLYHFEVNVRSSIIIYNLWYFYNLSFIIFFSALCSALQKSLTFCMRGFPTCAWCRCSCILFHMLQVEEFAVFAVCGLWHCWLTAACKCTWSRPITSPVSGSTFNTENDILVQWSKWIFLFICEHKHLLCNRDWKLSSFSYFTNGENMIKNINRLL